MIVVFPDHNHLLFLLTFFVYTCLLQSIQFIECWLGSFVICQGIWTSIAKKPYSFVIFHGGGGVQTRVGVIKI